MPERLNLLVVEDDESLRDALLITLETAGHRPMPPKFGLNSVASSSWRMTTC